MAEQVRTVEEKVEEDRLEAKRMDESTRDVDLIPAQKRDELRQTWLQVQSSFIDDPQDSVRKADGLVEELLRSVAEGFESARRQLEAEWQRGDDVNTESLRLNLRRYRALFDRLLAF